MRICPDLLPDCHQPAGDWSSSLDKVKYFKTPQQEKVELNHVPPGVVLGLSGALLLPSCRELVANTLGE